MNYYIQGNKEKAEEIKAAFERNGIDTSANSNYGISNLFYFSCNGEVAVTQNRSIINIIKTHPDYKELELPVQPKFKVGDTIQYKDNTYKIIGIHYDTQHYLVDGGTIGFAVQDCYHLWTIQDAKPGDVLMCESGWTCIFKDLDLFNEMYSSYCFMSTSLDFMPYSSECHTLDSRVNGKLTPATEKQHKLFFKKMKEAGYEWDADKKELKKIQPHYDIRNFKPFDKVLVRDRDESKWGNTYFGFYDEEQKVFVCDCYEWEQCIPFEGNEHLLGTTDPCDEMYINW